MSQANNEGGLDRRAFLKVTGLAGGGLLLGMTFAPGSLIAQELGTLVGSAELNVYVKVASDGTITILSANPEMGQGIKTALPMIVAEEMGALWSDVVVEQSDVDATRYGGQFSGGSTNIPRSFDLMRTMGASAREMLIGAASDAMELPRSELKARDSTVVHLFSKEQLSFGDLAAAAAKQDLPDPTSLKFKKPDEYTILGKSVSGVDNLQIVTGSSLYGIDALVDGMVFAAYQKCPAIGGSAVSANLKEVKRLPGVTDAFIVEGNGTIGELISGVAIVGDSTWAVFNAKSRLKVEWDESNASKDSWTELVRRGKELGTKPGANTVGATGDVDKRFRENRERTVEGFYTYPFVAHLCMEPMNCTAHYRAGADGEEASLEVWAPTQAPGGIAPAAKSIFGINPERVKVHQTRMGGGFGRRFSSEFVVEAIEISKRVGKPVKLTYSREDDIRNDFYRVGGFQWVKGAVDKNGKLAAWDQHMIGMQRDGRPVSGARFGKTEFPLLNLENVRGTLSMLDIRTPCGPWRAPGANTHAFVVQSFIHELAIAAGRDHLEFLLEMMGEPRWFNEGNIRSLNTGRAADVIRLAAEKAGWGKPMPPGRGLGLAFHFSHAAHVAEVADVSVDKNKKLTVNKVTVAVDIGPIINMSGATSQVAGSVVDGFSTMMGQQITMEEGRIQQSNLHDYQVLRIPGSPPVETHFIQSDNAPTGIGEPALPPVAPAVANAIFAATGVRVRTMPLSLAGYSV